MRKDVNAHVVVIASSNGFTAGARRRANGTSVLLLTATSDLLALLSDLGIPWGSNCIVAVGCIDDATVYWHEPSTPGIAFGRCEFCKSLHLLCPDCGAVFAVSEAEFGSPLSCPGDCGRHFIVHAGADDPVILSHDKLDSCLLLSAFGNKTRCISRGKVGKLVDRTKMRHWTEGDPTRRLVNDGLMFWSRETLCLTPEGQTRAAQLADAESPLHDGRLPDLSAYFPNN
jgi:hypothetical protein